MIVDDFPKTLLEAEWQLRLEREKRRTAEAYKRISELERMLYGPTSKKLNALFDPQYEYEYEHCANVIIVRPNRTFFRFTDEFILSEQYPREKILEYIEEVLKMHTNDLRSQLHDALNNVKVLK